MSNPTSISRNYDFQGAELEEEWSPDFRKPTRVTTGVTGAGLAEIKPHKARAIRKGLQQLRDYLQQSEKQRAGSSALAAAWLRAGVGGREPERTSVWLVTYVPSPENSINPKHVRVFAHKLRHDVLRGHAALPSLDALTLSRRELPMVALPSQIPFPGLNRPDMFGLAVEDLVRQGFATAYGRPGDPKHRQAHGLQGPDVLWREMASLYRELAEETGDHYWRELSEELSAQLAPSS